MSGMIIADAGAGVKRTSSYKLKTISYKLGGESMRKWLLRLGMRYAAVLSFTVLLLMFAARAGQAKAERAFEARLEQIRAEMQAEQRALQAMPLSEEGRRIELAEAIARMLYGIKDNDSADLKTACWCVFNRVDNAAYPDSIEDVINQSGQWMQYSPNNPVIEELYEIARGELDAWLDGTRRPCDSSFVFLDWTPDEVSLRDEYRTTRATKYWRMK